MKVTVEFNDMNRKEMHRLIKQLEHMIDLLIEDGVNLTVLSRYRIAGSDGEEIRA